MNVAIILVAYVIITTVLPLYYHYNEHHIFNTSHAALSFFLPLNILICVWEISLGLNIDFIKSEYQTLNAKYKGNKRFGAVMAFFATPVNATNLFSLKFWSKVWSTYSLYDPSYSNRESFGFFVDVGNGWTTLIPSCLFLVGMTKDIMSARMLGIVALVKSYQELYGTVIYFLSFILNKRYQGKGIIEVVLFVVFTNGLWFFFPLLGMWVGTQMILSDNYDCVRR